MAALALVAAPAVAGAQESPEAQAGHLVTTEVRASASVQNPAYALGVAAFRALPHAEVGAFVELNPWYSVERRSMSLGVTNLGVAAHFLHALRPDLRLRAGAGFGVSVLNQEMIGTDAGTRGWFLNLRLLGLVWDVADCVALTVDGFDLALPAPQLVGSPILYAQHRISVGLRFSL